MQPPLLQLGGGELHGPFQENCLKFAASRGVPVPIPVPGLRAWLIPLLPGGGAPDGGARAPGNAEGGAGPATGPGEAGDVVQRQREPGDGGGGGASCCLQLWEEELLEPPKESGCDQCRIIGWHSHPVSRYRYHFIVPAEEGPDSLKDASSLVAYAEPRWLEQQAGGKATTAAVEGGAAAGAQVSTPVEEGSTAAGAQVITPLGESGAAAGIEDGTAAGEGSAGAGEAMKVNTEGLVAVAEGGTAASGDAAAAGPSSAAGGESGAAVAGEAGAAAVPQTRTPTMADAAACFESTRHRLHGMVHANGYGHLLRVNGREGGSRSATGFQLTQLWDALCTTLRVRAVTTEDVSNKAGMELRVLNTAAHKVTWYGQFGYTMGRGAYNITRQQWRRAAEYVHAASLDALLFDFLGGVDDGVLAIVQRYRVAPPPGTPATLGAFLQRMLHLLSHPEEAVGLYQPPPPPAAAPAKRPRIAAAATGPPLTLAEVAAASRQLVETLSPGLPPDEAEAAAYAKALARVAFAPHLPPEDHLEEAEEDEMALEDLPETASQLPLLYSQQQQQQRQAQGGRSSRQRQRGGSGGLPADPEALLAAALAAAAVEAALAAVGEAPLPQPGGAAGGQQHKTLQQLLREKAQAQPRGPGGRFLPSAKRRSEGLLSEGLPPPPADLPPAFLMAPHYHHQQVEQQGQELAGVAAFGQLASQPMLPQPQQQQQQQQPSEPDAAEPMAVEGLLLPHPPPPAPAAASVTFASPAPLAVPGAGGAAAGPGLAPSFAASAAHATPAAAGLLGQPHASEQQEEEELLLPVAKADTMIPQVDGAGDESEGEEGAAGTAAVEAEGAAGTAAPPAEGPGAAPAAAAAASEGPTAGTARHGRGKRGAPAPADAPDGAEGPGSNPRPAKRTRHQQGAAAPAGGGAEEAGDNGGRVTRTRAHAAEPHAGEAGPSAPAAAAAAAAAGGPSPAGAAGGGGGGGKGEGSKYGQEVVGRRLRIYWKEQRTYYSGIILGYDSQNRKHHVRYHDGDEEHINLSKEKLQWSDSGPRKPALPAAPAAPPPAAPTAAEQQPQDASPSATPGLPPKIPHRKGAAASARKAAAAAAAAASPAAAEPASPPAQQQQEQHPADAVDPEQQAQQAKKSQHEQLAERALAQPRGPGGRFAISKKGEGSGDEPSSSPRAAGRQQRPGSAGRADRRGAGRDEQQQPAAAGERRSHHKRPPAAAPAGEAAAVAVKEEAEDAAPQQQQQQQLQQQPEEAAAAVPEQQPAEQQPGGPAVPPSAQPDAAGGQPAEQPVVGQEGEEGGAAPAAAEEPAAGAPAVVPAEAAAEAKAEPGSPPAAVAGGEAEGGAGADAAATAPPHEADQQQEQQPAGQEEEAGAAVGSPPSSASPGGPNVRLGCPSCRNTACSRCRKKAIQELEAHGRHDLVQQLGCDACGQREVGCTKCWAGVLGALGITRPKPAEYPPRDRRDRKGGKRSPPSAEAKAARGEGSRRRQAAAASPPGAAAAGPAAAAPGAAPAPGAAAAARTAALAKLAAAGKLPEAQQQAAEGAQQQQQPADGAPAEAGEVPSPTRRARAAAAVAPASPKAAAAPGAAPAAAPAARLGGPPDPEGARQALASGAVAVPTLGCGRCRQAPLGCRDCRKRQMKLWNLDGSEGARALASLISCADCSFTPHGCIKCWKAFYDTLGVPVPATHPTPRTDRKDRRKKGSSSTPGSARPSAGKQEGGAAGAGAGAGAGGAAAGGSPQERAKSRLQPQRPRLKREEYYSGASEEEEDSESELSLQEEEEDSEEEVVPVRRERRPLAGAAAASAAARAAAIAAAAAAAREAGPGAPAAAAAAHGGAEGPGAHGAAHGHTYAAAHAAPLARVPVHPPTGPRSHKPRPRPHPHAPLGLHGAAAPAAAGDGLWGGLPAATAPAAPEAPLFGSPAEPAAPLGAQHDELAGVRAGSKRERKPPTHWREAPPLGTPAAAPLGPASSAGPTSPSPTLMAHNAANTWGDCGDGWCGRAMLPYMITRRTVPVASRVLHNLLGRVPSSGEYVAMRDVNTNRTMRFEIKHVATANVYYVAGSEFGEWLSSSGIQPGEQLQFKAQGGEVLIRRGPMVPEADLMARPSSAARKRKKEPQQEPGRYAAEVVGLRVRVYWPQDQQWYPGRITGYQAHDGKHTVLYDGDREEEEAVDLLLDRVEFEGGAPPLPAPAPRPKKPRAPPQPREHFGGAYAGYDGGEAGAGAPGSEGRMVRPIRLKVRRPAPSEPAVEEGGSGLSVSAPETLPPDSLPREAALLEPFRLPPLPHAAGWSVERTMRAVRALLDALKGLAGMWVSRSKMRAQAMAAGLREPQFLDFGCRCLDCVLLDGWAVYRAQHPTYRALYYFAEQVGEEHVTHVAYPKTGAGKRSHKRGGGGGGDRDDGSSGTPTPTAAGTRGKGSLLRKILLRVPPGSGAAPSPPPEDAHPTTAGKRPRAPPVPVVPPLSELRLPPAGVLAPSDASGLPPPWSLLQPGGIPPRVLPAATAAAPQPAPQPAEGLAAAPGEPAQAPSAAPAQQQVQQQAQAAEGVQPMDTTAGPTGAQAPVEEGQPPAAAAAAAQGEAAEPPAAEAEQHAQPGAPLGPAGAAEPPAAADAQDPSVAAVAAAGKQAPPAPQEQALVVAAPVAAAVLPAGQQQQQLEEGPYIVSPEAAKQQLLCDLVYFFHLVLKVYKPMLALDAKVAAADAAAAAAGGASGSEGGALVARAPHNIRQPRLKRLPDEVQVLRDCKHFMKEYPGDRPLEGPQPPAGSLRLWCKVQLPQHLALPLQQHSKHSSRKPRMVTAPPELLVLPVGATLGDLRRAAAEAFRRIYRAFTHFQVTGVVGGLRRSVRFPPLHPRPTLEPPRPVAQPGYAPFQQQPAPALGAPVNNDFVLAFQQGIMDLHRAQQQQAASAVTPTVQQAQQQPEASLLHAGVVAAHAQQQVQQAQQPWAPWPQPGPAPAAEAAEGPSAAAGQAPPAAQPTTGPPSLKRISEAAVPGGAAAAGDVEMADAAQQAQQGPADQPPAAPAAAGEGTEQQRQEEEGAALATTLVAAAFQAALAAAGEAQQQPSGEGDVEMAPVADSPAAQQAQQVPAGAAAPAAAAPTPEAPAAAAAPAPAAAAPAPLWATQPEADGLQAMQMDLVSPTANGGLDLDKLLGPEPAAPTSSLPGWDSNGLCGLGAAGGFEGTSAQRGSAGGLLGLGPHFGSGGGSGTDLSAAARGGSALDLGPAAAAQQGSASSGEEQRDDSGLLLAELLPAAVVGSEAAAAAGSVPTVTVVGEGVEADPRWLHAGGTEDWMVLCTCGVKDDDGERMIACDICQTWMHTRCQGIPDEAPVPEVYHCFACTKRSKRH